jgi:hypothetical protein
VLDPPELTEIADGRTLQRLTSLLLEELGRTPLWRVRRWRRLSDTIDVVRRVESELRRGGTLRHDTATRRQLL